MLQQDLSQEIAYRLRESKESLKKAWEASTPVRHCYLDDLLPEPAAQRIYDSLPDPSTLMLRDTIKERKRVGIRVEDYAPEMEAILFSFQHQDVIDAVTEITGLTGLTADSSLYGSGISQMLEGDFLLPHLDNSHDGDGRLYRVLNLLYYITPDWPESGGGNLELWDKPMKVRKEIHARFNRLVLMETHTESVHSVTKVLQPGGMRACISNYYFSPTPANHIQHIHKTTFYARPEDSAVKKLKLGFEGTAKKFLSRFLSNSKSNTKHRRDK
jgi:Rps23 Pro-64 3,4-dihydroxylase Tpa1-like proline 4-hydroxylase